MDEKLIRAQLDYCLSTEDKMNTKKWEEGFEDPWQVQRINLLITKSVVQTAIINLSSIIIYNHF